MNNLAQQPYFLIGAQRSGTTALGIAISRAMFSNGGVFTVNGKLLYYMRRWWQDPVSNRHLRADEVIHSLHRRVPMGEGIAEWLTRTEQALRTSAERIANSGGRIDIDEEIREICRKSYSGAEIWGDKYNEYLMDLHFLHRVFPKANYIFIARDPVQTICSMLNWSGDRPWNPKSVDYCGKKWAAWNERWLRFRERIPKARRIELCYDNFDDRSIRTLSRMIGVNVSSYLVEFCPRKEPGADQIDIPYEASRVWTRIKSIV